MKKDFDLEAEDGSPCLSHGLLYELGEVDKPTERAAAAGMKMCRRCWKYWAKENGFDPDTGQPIVTERLADFMQEESARLQRERRRKGRETVFSDLVPEDDVDDFGFTVDQGGPDDLRDKWEADERMTGGDSLDAAADGTDVVMEQDEGEADAIWVAGETPGLKPREQETLFLVTVTGRPVEEAARMMSATMVPGGKVHWRPIKVATVKKYLARAMLKAKRYFAANPLTDGK